MGKTFNEKPATSQFLSRFEEEGDWIAHQMFSDADLRLSPEEYAARNAHRFGDFALHHHRFNDEKLGIWVRRFGEIFDDADKLEQCRQQYLTLEERANVHKSEAEGF